MVFYLEDKMTKEPLSKEASRKIVRFWIRIGVLMVVVFILLGVALGPLGCSITNSQKFACLQTTHTLMLALYSYANDHGGKYPEGKSSTEVFQQLLDQGYITDPGMLCITSLRLPGKVRANNNHLKPENVTWDVTCCVDSTTSEDCPTVFLTGYKVTYEPGRSAVLAYTPHARTWSEWWDGLPAWEPFMSYARKSNAVANIIANADGTIPNFIPADFDPKGKTYRQLTP